MYVLLIFSLQIVCIAHDGVQDFAYDWIRSVREQTDDNFANLRRNQLNEGLP